MQRPDIALYYTSDFFSPSQADQLYNDLYSEIAWQQGHIFIYGKEHPIPRLQAWYSNAAIDYRYSGKTLQHQPFTATLNTLREKLERHLHCQFNGVLCNLYRNGDDHMGWHSDDEASLGANPLIASLSFGAERDFVLREKNSGEKIKIPLAHGSLLVMSGPCQHHWQHALPKRGKIKQARINLTFRLIHS